MNMKTRIILIITLMFITGCSDEILYDGLKEREVNKIIMILRAAGLKPSKNSENDTIQLLIPPDEFQEAMLLLEKVGLPRRKNSAEDYINSEGSSALVNSAKYTDFVNSQIEEAIYDLPYVTSVHVLSFIPESHAGRDSGEANISIAITYSGDLDVDDVLPKIEAFVTHAIPSLLPDNVSVQLFEK